MHKNELNFFQRKNGMKIRSREQKQTCVYFVKENTNKNADMSASKLKRAKNELKQTLRLLYNLFNLLFINRTNFWFSSFHSFHYSLNCNLII